MNTDTPITRILREKLGNAKKMLGEGKRASTLSMALSLWLSTAYVFPFPSETANLVDSLQMRSKELTTRGGLKAAHLALRFLEQVTA